MNRPMILRRLHADHTRLRQVFSVLEHQMAGFSGSDACPDFALLQDLLDYVIAYPDTIHHPLEDRLFEFVVSKGVTPTELRLVLSNRDQHLEIRSYTQKLYADVRYVLNGAVIPAAKLRADAAAYLDLQRAHMLIEERQLFPLADRLLSFEDWATLERELGATQDPMFDNLAEHFADLHRYILETDRAGTE
jgi:hemerythrin-like domain-containing protein